MMADIIVLALIAAAVIAAVRHMIKQRGTCSCGCSNCSSGCCGKKKK